MHKVQLSSAHIFVWLYAAHFFIMSLFSGFNILPEVCSCRSTDSACSEDLYQSSLESSKSKLNKSSRHLLETETYFLNRVN